MINELQLCADDSKFGSDFDSSCDGFQSVTEVEANGVGSLLAMMQGSGSDYIGYYFADANGNITRMYGTNDLELASYRYNPFGNITNATGSWAGQNRYQWSSKENDAATGLVYYLYRFYSPELGRCVYRDPIEEEGGVNLYGMVGNDAANYIDLDDRFTHYIVVGGVVVVIAGYGMVKMLDIANETGKAQGDAYEAMGKMVSDPNNMEQHLNDVKKHHKEYTEVISSLRDEVAAEISQNVAGLITKTGEATKMIKDTTSNFVDATLEVVLNNDKNKPEISK